MMAMAMVMMVMMTMMKASFVRAYFVLLSELSHEAHDDDGLLADIPVTAKSSAELISSHSVCTVTTRWAVLASVAKGTNPKITTECKPQTPAGLIRSSGKEMVIQNQIMSGSGK